MLNVKVKNIIGHNGDPVKNQFIIYTDHKKYFQSYSSIIACIDENGRVFLDSDTWDYSSTTGKYRNIFLGESKAETLKKIKSGEYILTDLN